MSEDTSVPQDLYNELKDVLDKVYEFGKAKPLAGALLALKVQGALQRIENDSVLRAHNDEHVTWAKIGSVMGMRSPQGALERYAGSPKKTDRRRKLVTNAVIAKHLRDDNLITLPVSTPEKPPPKVKE